MLEEYQGSSFKLSSAGLGIDDPSGWSWNVWDSELTDSYESVILKCGVFGHCQRQGSQYC